MKKKYENSIAIDSKLNPEEQVLWDILLANATDDLFKKEYFTIEANKLLNLWNKDKSIKELNNSLRKIDGVVIYKKYNGTKKIEGTFSILDYIELKDNIYIYSFSEPFKEVFMVTEYSIELSECGYTSGLNFYKKIQNYYLALQKK